MNTDTIPAKSCAIPDRDEQLLPFNGNYIAHKAIKKSGNLISWVIYIMLVGCANCRAEMGRRTFQKREIKSCQHSCQNDNKKGKKRMGWLLQFTRDTKEMHAD